MLGAHAIARGASICTKAGMTAETWFRIIFALIAIGMACLLAASLVTGRTRVGGRIVDRGAAPRVYWGSVGKAALLMTGLASAPLLPPERDALPVVFLGLFGGQLFEMLVSGTVQMPAMAYHRAVQPRPYWGWVVFHAAIVAVLLVFLIAQRFRPIIL
jgi:hypothetical protein